MNDTMGTAKKCGCGQVHVVDQLPETERVALQKALDTGSQDLRASVMISAAASTLAKTLRVSANLYALGLLRRETGRKLTIEEAREHKDFVECRAIALSQLLEMAIRGVGNQIGGGVEVTMVDPSAGRLGTEVPS